MRKKYTLGTDPLNPDTDGVGYPDGLEVALGSDPLNPNSIPTVKSSLRHRRHFLDAQPHFTCAQHADKSYGGRPSGSRS